MICLYMSLMNRLGADMSWYVIQYKPSQGIRAEVNLSRQGIQCFFPQIQVERIIQGRRSSRKEALFPSYMFIDMQPSDPLWVKVRSTRGVMRIVQFGGNAAEIDDDVIEHIRSTLHDVSAQGGLKQGYKIRIKSGPFMGIEAVFQSFDGDQRAMVIIEFLYGKQQVRVPTLSIAPL